MAFPLRHRSPGSAANVPVATGEVVSLVTSLEPARLNAQDWLKNNRLAWVIENGLHLRLDVSQNDDCCRLRTPKGLWIMGMFRRLANSLFVHWQSQHPKPQYKTTTDFQSHFEEENLRRAMIFVSATRPSLKPAS